MTDDELLRLVGAEESASLGYIAGDLSNERQRALEFYHGNLDVAAPTGRSDVVSTDVRDAVDGMLPDLMDVFLSSDDVVKFEPQGPEDEQGARQATDVCNYVFYKQNNGALLMYEWFKTALLEKNAVVKYWWDNSEAKTKEMYQGLTDLQFQMLVQNPNVEVIGYEQIQSQMGVLHNVQLSVTNKKGKVCIEGVPTEEFLISAKAKSLCLQDSPFTAQRTKMMGSDLMEMGIDLEGIKASSGLTNTDFSPEYLARRRYQEEREPLNEPNDPALRLYDVLEAYVRADFDGDGYAELRRVLRVGNTIVQNDEADHVPFAAICPVIMPYRFYGLSIADLVTDIQRQKSVIWRQMLDSLYLANNPRIGVMENMVNLDDLLVSRPGGVVRFKTMPSQAMMPIETRFVGQQAFPMVEYMDTVKESRTGFTRYSQGMDADSLNKTATGISMITNNSAKRLKLVARMFAETGVKDLFRGILHMLSKYNSKPLTMRLRNNWVDVDPRLWKEGWDVSVNVGLGTGDKAQENAQLQVIVSMQDMLKKTGVPHLVSDSNQYNAAKRLAENAGFKQEGEFFTPPGPNNPAPQPPPPPEVLKIQADQQKAQAEIQAGQAEKAAEIQSAQAIARIQAETTIAVAQIKAAADKEIEQMKMRHEAEMGVFEAGVDQQKHREEMHARKEEAAAKGAASGVKIKTPNANLKLPSAEDNAQATLKAIQPLVDVLGKAIQTMGEAANAPKEVVRDAQGNIIGTRLARMH